MMARAEQQRKLMSNAKKLTSKAAPPALLNQIADDESIDEAATMAEDQSQE